MKKTYLKSIWRTIRHSLSRFLAIFSIVALGSGFLAGVLASPLDMRLSADNYCDQGNMFDLRAVSTLGLTEDDITALAQVEGVADVQPAYDLDLVLRSEEGDAYTTRLHTLAESDGGRINTPILVEGRLPQKAGECAVVLTKSFFKGSNWVGQTLTLEEENEALPRQFTVVGTVKTPLYMSLEQEYTTAGSGSLGLMAYTVAENFDQDYYTTAYLTLEGSQELNAFDGAYEQLVADAAEKLEALGEQRAGIRYQDIMDEANAQLADARKEYEDGKKEAEEELEKALKELQDGEKKLADSEQKLADAEQELADGRKGLEEGRTKYQAETADAKQRIRDGRDQISGYQSQIDSGRAQLRTAQAQLNGGFEELAANEAELAGAKEELDKTQANLDALDQGKAALEQTAAQLGLPAGDGSDQSTLALISQLEQLAPEAAQAFAQLKAGLEALAAQGTDTAGARQAIETGLAQYHTGLAQAQQARTRLEESQRQLNAQLTQLEQQQAQLTSQKAELDRSEAALQQAMRDAEAEFAQAEKDLAQGQADYDEGLQKLEDGKKDLAQGWDEYETGRTDADRELADAEEKIHDAQADIDKIEACEWYIFDRKDNAGFSSYADNADKIAAIAQVFPVFFFLVAALVALTTMTRMVEEERQLIGTMKALGYSSLSIAAKYLLYAAAASLFGCAAGVAVGMWLFPTIIVNAYNIMYDLPQALTPFNWTLALVSAVTAVLCTLTATLSACWHALKEVPARLMLPKAPKAGKRILLEYITPLWSRLKFTQKVTARNLFRYKKRFFMTVLGIAGCTALLVTGFGIRDSISDIVELQYTQLSQYQLIVALNESEALETPGLMEILSGKDRVLDYLPALQDSGTVIPEAGRPEDSVTIFATPQGDRLPEFFHFRHRTDSQPVDYNENSVIITEKLAERHRLSVGDRITVKNQDEDQASFVITDICENYVHHYLYLSPAAYQEAFGQEATVNSLLCKLPEEGPRGGEEALTTDLLQCGGVAMTTSTKELSASFHNSLQSINSIVLVLIISAGALAFVVLYNLTNINITEREKELATIKVLGFYQSEVAAYIYRESAMLTLIGTGVGLLLGVVLHQFVIRTAEVDLVMFGRNIYPLSYIFATLLTFLFSLLVSLVMYKKLANISMVESMKAPE